MNVQRYPKDAPPNWALDEVAKPRDPISAIHGATEGAWSYRTIAPGDIILPEWNIVARCGERILIKYTHWERSTL